MATTSCCALLAFTRTASLSVWRACVCVAAPRVSQVGPPTDAVRLARPSENSYIAGPRPEVAVPLEYRTGVQRRPDGVQRVHFNITGE